jgi:hypothetical protein
MTPLVYQVLLREDANGVVASLEELECFATGQTTAEAVLGIRLRAIEVLQRYGSAAVDPPVPAKLSLIALGLSSDGSGATGPSDVVLDGRRLEQVLVIHLLTGPRTRPWSFAELETEFADLKPAEVVDALARLASAEVIRVDGDLVYPHASTQYLDALGMVTL